MKRIILILLVIIPLFAYSQKDMYDESLEGLDKMDEILTSEMSSFSAYPQVHSNTIKVHKKISEINKLLKEQQFSKYSFSSNTLANPKVQDYFKKVNEMQVFAEIFNELLMSFKGYVPTGLTQNQMTILDQLLRGAGWKITLLDINCRDAYFYEYQFNGFKMMFIKNTLPPVDNRNHIYNNIEVSYTNNHYGEGGMSAVGGGKYRMIQFQDDENPRYYKIIKASSVRQ